MGDPDERRDPAYASPTALARLLAHTADLMLAEVYAADEGAPPDAVGPDGSRLTATSAVADASASVLVPADRLHRAHARAKRKSAEVNAAAGVLASLDEAEHAGPAAQRLASLLRSRAVDFSQQVRWRGLHGTSYLGTTCGQRRWP